MVLNDGELVGGGVGSDRVGALVGLIVVLVGLVDGASLSPSSVGAADGEYVVTVGFFVGGFEYTVGLMLGLFVVRLGE